MALALPWPMQSFLLEQVCAPGPRWQTFQPPRSAKSLCKERSLNLPHRIRQLLPKWTCQAQTSHTSKCCASTPPQCKSGCQILALCILSCPLHVQRAARTILIATCACNWQTGRLLEHPNLQMLCLGLTSQTLHHQTLSKLSQRNLSWLRSTHKAKHSLVQH